MVRALRPLFPDNLPDRPAAGDGRSRFTSSREPANDPPVTPVRTYRPGSIGEFAAMVRGEIPDPEGDRYLERTRIEREAQEAQRAEREARSRKAQDERRAAARFKTEARKLELARCRADTLDQQLSRWWAGVLPEQRTHWFHFDAIRAQLHGVTPRPPAPHKLGLALRAAGWQRTRSWRGAQQTPSKWWPPGVEPVIPPPKPKPLTAHAIERKKVEAQLAQLAQLATARAATPSEGGSKTLPPRAPPRVDPVAVDLVATLEQIARIHAEHDAAPPDHEDEDDDHGTPTVFGLPDAPVSTSRLGGAGNVFRLPEIDAATYDHFRALPGHAGTASVYDPARQRVEREVVLDRPSLPDYLPVSKRKPSTQGRRGLAARIAVPPSLLERADADARALGLTRTAYFLLAVRNLLEARTTRFDPPDEPK